jgi:hypothetical protein
MGLATKGCVPRMRQEVHNFNHHPYRKQLLTQPGDALPSQPGSGRLAGLSGFVKTQDTRTMKPHDMRIHIPPKALERRTAVPSAQHEHKLPPYWCSKLWALPHPPLLLPIPAGLWTLLVSCLMLAHPTVVAAFAAASTGTAVQLCTN